MPGFAAPIKPWIKPRVTRRFEHQDPFINIHSHKTSMLYLNESAIGPRRRQIHARDIVIGPPPSNTDIAAT